MPEAVTGVVERTLGPGPCPPGLRFWWEVWVLHGVSGSWAREGRVRSTRLVLPESHSGAEGNAVAQRRRERRTETGTWKVEGLR